MHPSSAADNCYTDLRAGAVPASSALLATDSDHVNVSRTPERMAPIKGEIACPNCGDADHLYTSMEFKLDAGMWSATGCNEDFECTSCDAKFAEGQFNGPKSPRFLPVEVIERTEAFLARIEDDAGQKTVAELLREVRTAFGSSRET